MAALLSLAPRATHDRPTHNIGPGEYGAPLTTKRRIPAANIGPSTAKDQSMETTPAFTPGPGAYSIPDDISVNALKSRFNPTLTSERFKNDRNPVPGPGAYSLPDELSQKTAKKYSQPGHMTVLYDLYEPPALSIPTIPKLHAGYDEKDGVMRVQPVHDDGCTGVGTDTVGPGAYNIAKPLKVKGQTFATADYKRGQFQTAVPSSVGPGSYTGQLVSRPPAKSHKGRNFPSPAFASVLPRIADPAQSKADLPGPGQYDVSTHSIKHRVDTAIYGLPPAVFDGSSARLIDPPARAPGPAFYNPKDPGGFREKNPVSIYEPRLKPSVPPFLSTTDRFAAPAQHTLGPGQYDAAQPVRKRNPAPSFGGAERFKPLTMEPEYELPDTHSRVNAQTPGYQYTGSCFARNRSVARRARDVFLPSAAFCSEAGRFPNGLTQRPQGADAGSYSPQLPKGFSPWAKDCSFGKSSRFGGGTQSFLGKASNGVPGPDAYQNVAVTPAALDTRHFLSTDARFRAPDTLDVGVGQYNLQAPLVKPSFNVRANPARVKGARVHTGPTAEKTRKPLKKTSADVHSFVPVATTISRP